MQEFSHDLKSPRGGGCGGGGGGGGGQEKNVLKAEAMNEVFFNS